MKDLAVISKGGWSRMLKDVPAIYLKRAQDFVGFMRSGDFQLGDPDGLTAYEKHLNRVHTEGRMKGKRFSASTINSYIDAARDRLGYALKNSLDLTVAERMVLEENLKMKRLKRPSPAVLENKVLSDKEVKKFLSKCPDKTISLIFEFLNETACRISEALQVLVKELRPAGEDVLIAVRGKGSKDREIFVPAEMIGRIQNHFRGGVYLFEHHGKCYRREYVSMTIKRQGRKILNREISAHTLRHTWATTTLKNSNGDIKGVQEYLGHANGATTINLYAHSHFSQTDLRSLREKRRLAQAN